MKKRAFTLMEVVVVVIIVGVLATLGFPAYQNSIEYSNEKVCKANLAALQTGLDIYAMEHDKIPGDLTQLPAEYIKKGLAKAQKEGGWKLKLAYWMVGVQESGLAYAGLKQDLQGGVVMNCPAAKGGHSYGLWTGLKDMTSQEYRRLSGSQVLIADSRTDEFGSAAGIDERHAKHAILSPESPFGLASLKGGNLAQVHGGVIISIITSIGTAYISQDGGIVISNPNPTPLNINTGTVSTLGGGGASQDPKDSKVGPQPLK